MKKLEITIRDPNKPEDTKKLTYFNIFRFRPKGHKNRRGRKQE